MIKEQELIKMAIKARKKGVATLTGFRVGVALEGRSGKIYTAANFESEICSLSSCAERNAIGYAITNGEKGFRRIAIVGSTSDPCPPCGACRQFMLEFAPDVEIIMASMDGKRVVRARPRELLPSSYRLPKDWKCV